MKSLRVAIFVCMVCLCFGHVSLAQAVFGSTSIDIDPDTGNVTATCETDTDADAEAYYSAEVHCVVEDSNNNTIASGTATDDTGQGYAQVVLTFAGVPGTTYIATGMHEVKITYTVEVDDPPQPIVLRYDDMYNFGFFSEARRPTTIFTSGMALDRRPKHEPVLRAQGILRLRRLTHRCPQA
jgi:hypothetical protein